MQGCDHAAAYHEEGGASRKGLVKRKPTAYLTAAMQTLRTLKALEREGLVTADPRLAEAARSMAIALTPELAELIDRKDLARDPIARQFVPDIRETEVAPEERDDPIGDEVRSPVKGIVHRYPDRVLLKPLHVCPVYCRFCFRREKVGPGGDALSATELAAALAYIRDHAEIWEVILTGGDPLMMAPRRLGQLIDALDGIPHVTVIRVHTRVPIADAGRVTDELVTALKPKRAGLWVGIHCNHARELSPPARAALARLADAGFPLLSQTVLLAGINDDVETLCALMRALVSARVKPYYLHHPDLVRGTGHFRVPIARGQALMKALRGRLSGLAQPTYVLDVPGGHGKVPVGPAYLGDDPDALVSDARIVEDAFGGRHRYPA
ncbi:MAG: lysine-2,3-aminomutase-like protein [Proteobacteria bacterium]|nr:lysine-2,3-aminomutase-like protein [Pseudomonadota bacterium]